MKIIWKTGRKEERKNKNVRMIYQMKEEKQMAGEKEKKKTMKVHERNNKGSRIRYERKNQMRWNERSKKKNGKKKE